MFYEFRFYTLPAGRMADVRARFRKSLPAIFARHGIDNIGCWEAVSGSGGPLWVYAMRYPDLSERTRVWGGFYSDDEWWAVRAATNAGEEMVDRFALDFLQANRLDPRLARLPSDGIHELRLIEQPVGRTSESIEFIEKSYIPILSSHGAKLLLAADCVTGPRLPQTALLLHWETTEQQREASLEVAADPALRAAFAEQRAQFRHALIGRSDAYLLQPVLAAT